MKDTAIRNSDGNDKGVSGENESNIGKDNIKSEKTMIWLVVGGVLLVCAGIGFVIWKKKGK